MREMFFEGIVRRCETWVDRTIVITLFVSVCPIRSLFFDVPFARDFSVVNSDTAIVIVCFSRNATSERSAARASSWHGYLPFYQGSARALSMQNVRRRKSRRRISYLLHEARNLAELCYTVTGRAGSLHYLCISLYFFSFQPRMCSRKFELLIVIIEIVITQFSKILHP